MLWIRDFVRKYPQSIVTGPVPLEHIIEKLKRAYNAESIPLEEFPDYQRRIHTQNAYYFAQEEQLDLKMEDIQIKAVRIPVTDLTRHYTEHDFVRWFVGGKDDADGIYVVYENQAGYFYCNSSMLHLEIAIARGISEGDIQNQTETYQQYIRLMQRYIEEYTDFEDRYGLVWSQEMTLI